MFVRQDMALADQIVQSNHAVLTISSSAYSFTGIPNIVLIGVPDKAALDRVTQKLAANAIPHCAWSEPDLNLGFTAIATIALTTEQKQPLARYRLWRPIYSPVVQLVEQPAAFKSSGKLGVQILPGEPSSTDAPLAQRQSSGF